MAIKPPHTIIKVKSAHTEDNVLETHQNTRLVTAKVHGEEKRTIITLGNILF